MKNKTSRLNLDNINSFIIEYESSLVDIGSSLRGKVGIPLLQSVKRDQVWHGPYPDVTFFEAANRIMTDLVIIYGVNTLLKNNKFNHLEYTVEFGNENHNDFDIQAGSSENDLVGEAFNVAPSFFQTKKSHAINKLKKKGAGAKTYVLIFNADATPSDYQPRKSEFYHVAVDIFNKKASIY
jgi:hypothetical protein